MLKELSAPLDLQYIQRKRLQIRKQLLSQSDVQWLDKRIAVLAGSTTQDIVAYLELFLLDNGIRPVFYESDYGMYFEDAIYGNATLDAFHPDIILIHTSVDNIRDWPSADANVIEVSELLDQTFATYISIWESLRHKFRCALIQNNFEAPFYRVLGNADASDIHGHTYFVNELNMRFAKYAQTHSDLHLHDVHWLSASVGLDRWANRKHWHLYKSAMDISLTPLYSQSVSFIIKSIFGLNKKALVLDLDNTLWGGVVGEVGQEGILIGAGIGEGEAFFEFQRYLKQLAQVGILLNVNSKNSEENAKSGLMHPAGLLRPEDFICLYANWNSKDRNLVDIAKALNIGTDSIVFVDDNPAERELVSTSLSSVCCPAISQVESYIRVLDRNGYFENTGISFEDLHRSASYHATNARKQAESSFTDYNDYLCSLEMTAAIAVPQRFQYQRIVQLMNKTNQFNLTTKRYSEAEFLAVMESAASLCLLGSLCDKFGDNGIVSVILGFYDEAVLYIDIFIMSCRVFKRGMEDAMMNTWFEYAKVHGIKKIVGRYMPTAKNGMVATLFGDYGFSCVKTEPNGQTEWTISVDAYKPKRCNIQIETAVEEH